MPELAEVKIMSDFINNVVGLDTFFESVEKSPVSKVKTELNPFDGAVFTMNAKSRGKELMIHMEMVGGDSEGAVTKNLSLGMGMSGNWIFIKKDSDRLEEALKHGHLRFKSTRGNYLIMYDVRRFAKWKWVDGWAKNRGYCPLTEYNEFSEAIRTHFNKHKDFNTPLYLLLMSQKWFNGVGNYLRAEILHRLNIDPFQPMNQLSKNELDSLIQLVHFCVRDAYTLGGGQLKDWQNPFMVEGASMKDWIQCYGKLNWIKDKSGRRFWYDPKWEESATITIGKDSDI